MAKTCAYLCRHCRFIDGFGEFGEFSFTLTSWIAGSCRCILSNMVLTLSF